MTDKEYMDFALSLAEKTIGQTSPNPSVGAVVVKDGRILGIGSHLKAGEAHAEVHALAQAGEEAEGADIYVTLEPCSHHGKTPPCADLIIKHKLKKVIIACLDPNPVVAGNGVEKLRQAGIDVEIGVREARALELNRKFFHYIHSKRPYVTLKAAVTLDGKTATSTGDSKWITSDQARVDVHQQRAIHDAILVGVETVIKDNPHLTTRLPQGGKNPIRVILDTQLRIQKEANVLKDGHPTWIFCSENADGTQIKEKYPNLTIFQLPGNYLNINDVLDILGEKSIQSLYVEGGSKVHQSFIQQQLVNECHWYIAPKILGGTDAISVVGGSSPLLMKDATSLDIVSTEMLGPDIKIIARPRKVEE
ncbi:bifunctional diaminohydroxyphosphoribosylaminopyrimidine deaminase/5-amino-6-(5-phosphoribosylamino)uracil reductase RibD [Aquibacillus salsiterrae]|uniref:Riboflavin biosynthesis protein RibD n=1 Tax=Aquibacillus salsiterrae TaxID=2950439 RepID=A0A9X3WDL4_9BACI|nr:bifunctional diaminohydroxyphosphoribosylaminopyrimidine deaminase/5-amino-6-(5-phosphoribosylamino)uracil reductase RibD [Aquibacillus salsiterrae]MDC3417073.1 bifunctional diaminohydroxyphosphoribosylaminopyrimidine deaminase/5-amino-6-(5-phosphoribosylamino)uracil reductase RibD [Aquibacillus salsiterrae]